MKGHLRYTASPLALQVSLQLCRARRLRQNFLLEAMGSPEGMVQTNLDAYYSMSMRFNHREWKFSLYEGCCKREDTSPHTSPYYPVNTRICTSIFIDTDAGVKKVNF